MTEKEFIESINDTKILLSVEQYDYLVSCKSKYLEICSILRDRDHKVDVSKLKRLLEVTE